MKNGELDYLSCLAGLYGKDNIPEEFRGMSNEEIKANIAKFDEDNRKLQSILSGNISKTGVWSASKHREAIFDPFRVIINDKTENEEAEILVITNSLVYRITNGDDGNFVITTSKINEIYDINGRRVKE